MARPRSEQQAAAHLHPQPQLGPRPRSWTARPARRRPARPRRVYAAPQARRHTAAPRCSRRGDSAQAAAHAEQARSQGRRRLLPGSHLRATSSRLQSRATRSRCLYHRRSLALDGAASPPSASALQCTRGRCLWLVVSVLSVNRHACAIALLELRTTS